MNNDDLIEKLTLLLLYLTSFEEDSDLRRSWKGYPFNALNDLEEKGMIDQSRKAKSVSLSLEGIRKVEELQLQISQCLEKKPQCDR